MNKELEALKRIRFAEVQIGNDPYTATRVFDINNDFDECFEIIKTALKRLEKLEVEFTNCVIEGAKQKKALEIIKNKCEFDFLEEKINDMPIRYEIHIRPKNKEQLLFSCLAIYPKNQEEFDLLKEVLL